MNSLEQLKENYIDGLMINQDNGADPTQRGLFSRREYSDLITPVVEIIKNNPDLSIEELREKIFNESNLREKVLEFVGDKKLTPYLSLSYGTKNYTESFSVSTESDVKIDKNTIYDLASVTKLFTSISILRLHAAGLIDLNDDVTKYAPEFNNLKGVSIMDLLTFQVPLKTDGRVDKATDKEEAYNILKRISINENDNRLRPYTDMGAMVLKYVVENVTGISMYEFVDFAILRKLDMQDTHVVVPEEKLARVASTSNAGYFYKDGNVRFNEVPIGTVYDDKARVLGQTEGNLSGHAGLFSTADNMTKLAKSLINYDILDKNQVFGMSENKTGKTVLFDESEKVIQYLGQLVYSKNPVKEDTEVYHALSGRSFASQGWTGPQLSVDPLNGIYAFMGASKPKDRMVYVDSAQSQNVETLDSGLQIVHLPNGEDRVNSSRFAWEKDEGIIRPALALALQYRFLEHVYELELSKKTEKNYEKRLKRD